MRHLSALSSLKFALSALLLGLVAGMAGAQIPFTDTDWTLDRGVVNVNGAFNPQFQLRQGYNNFPAANNDPQYARRRWVWPNSADIAELGIGAALFVDNPYPGIVKANESNGQQASDALAFGFPNGFGLPNSGATWIIPDQAFRVPQGGFSYVQDPNVGEAFDYGVTTPVHNDFNYTVSGGVVTPPVDQLAQLPYVPAQVYKAVHTTLINLTTGNNPIPTAVWTIGTSVNVPTPAGGVTPTNVPQGYYSIDIWSPGDGTLTGTLPNNTTPHPNVFHVLVRVSYKGTVNANNTLNFGNYPNQQAGTGGINDPIYSRIFMVDMTGSPGWRHIGPSQSATTSSVGLNPSAFYFDGLQADQITVTLYAVTPDNLNDQNLYTNPPLLTADAVRFVPLSVLPANLPPDSKFNPINSDIAPISGSGRILAEAVGSNKIATQAGDPSAGLNLFYVAREEELPNPNFPDPLAQVTLDPTQTNPPTDLTPQNDPTAVISEPVFYCLNNEDEEQVDANGNPILVNNNPAVNHTKTRVRWRVLGTPDAGDGTSIASPLLANVRCRDGQTRPMVFFATTNSSGSLGHIYAFDPVGNNPFGADPGDLSTRTTTAYWIYPSWRPLRSTTNTHAANEPPNAPAEWYDPNFTAPATLTGGFNRTGYPNPTFGNDQGTDAKGHLLYDGDIVPQNSAQEPYITRSDTRLTMPGMAWAPTLINDPDNAGGPQILIVTGQSYNASSQTIGGRIYAFDAGGRGDFGTYNDADNVPHPAAGTTQRLWTWPHFGADSFHRLYPPDPNSGWSMAFTIQDELPKGYFGGSPVFDPSYPTTGQVQDVNAKPLMVGSSDGHVYAVLPFHDIFNGVSNNKGLYSNREEWVYPAENQPGLQAPPSTLAFLQTTGGNRYLYFTADLPDGTGGRIYSLNEFPPGQPGTIAVEGSGPFLNSLYWVFPSTTAQALPFPDPNNPNTTQPLFPGFGPSAPIAITANFANLNNPPAGPNLPAVLQIPQDMIYAVQNDGTVVPIYADPANTGLGIPAGQNQLFIDPNDLVSFSDTTTATPNASHIQPIPTSGLFDNTQVSGIAYTTQFPCAVFGDDSGSIWGVGMTAIDDGTNTPHNPPGPNGGGPGTMLPLVWTYSDAGNTRYAPAMLCNAYILEGDENGQMHAYSVGVGANGEGETVPPTETLNNPGLVDIDIRGVDFFNFKDWQNFMPGSTNTAGAETPANGGAPPLVFNPPIDNANGIAVDWGGSLYIAAWGVYHAQPTAPGSTPVQGSSPPTITVSFTITQPGGGGPRTVTVPAIMANPGNAANQLWPLDGGFPAASIPQLTIWGWDPDTQGPNSTPGQLQSSGMSAPPNVYPWVAKYKLDILPDAQHPYPPGPAGIRVSARAEIKQYVTVVGGGVNGFNINNYGGQPLTYITPRLFAGQHDANGLQPEPGNPTIGRQTSPNNFGPNGLGRPRRTYISNPIALTTRGHTPGGTPATDMTNLPNVIGWAGSIEDGANDRQELLGNGPSFGVIGNTGFKPLFAPIDMTEYGSSVTYTGNTNANNRIPALFAEDRSAYSMISGHRLEFRVTMPSLSWHGGPYSVMNPLPWDQLPDDVHDTLDYPAIPSNNVHIMSNGVDVTQTQGFLLPPTPGTGGNGPIIDRIPQPTEMDMTIQVPKYQPANVNRGVIQIGNLQYGSGFVDVAGNQNGMTAGSTPILGPINTDSGNQPANIVSGTFPAAGYLAQNVEVAAFVSGQPINRGLPRTGYNTVRNTQAWRAYTTGMCVPPTFKMHTQEQTLDFGKLPMGAGYTDIDPSSNFYRVPFQPSGVGYFQQVLNGTWNVPPSPWDSDALLGDFFRPFTLISDSNVNLVDLGIAKFYGQVGATINQDSLATNPVQPPNTPGTAVAARLPSDDVGESLMPPLLGAAFGRAGSNASGPGLGNMGFVTSFDHTTPTFALTSEQPVWPLINPTVDQNAINQATQLNQNAPGLLVDPVSGTGWQVNQQPRPTLHKPRVGDNQGTVATIPDVPRDFTTDPVQNAQYKPQPPKIGIAIPMGTPAGNYSGPIIPYEDGEPIQWKEWVSASGGPPLATLIAGNHDGIYNVNAAAQPVEPAADPAPIAKVVVEETRLTGGATQGSLSQIDPVDFTNLLYPNVNIKPINPQDPKVDPHDPNSLPYGFNVLPTVLQVPTSLTNWQIFLYWTTNRQVQGGPFTPNNNANSANPDAPIGLAYTALSTPYQQFNFNGQTVNRSDALFGIAGTGSETTLGQNPPDPNARWWPTPVLYPGYQGSGLPADYNAQQLMPDLFPSGGTPAGVPFVPGPVVPSTVRYGSPAAALDYLVSGNGAPANVTTDAEAYLVWLGQVDKQQSPVPASTSGTQRTESRLFWAALNNGVPQPIGANFYLTNSYLNDPALPKLTPKPLLLKMAATTDTNRSVQAQKMLYIFWASGSQGRTQLYYNANVLTNLNGTFTPAGWETDSTNAADTRLGDQLLPTPQALQWQSDPYPVFRRVYARNPFGPANDFRIFDAIDVYYTGVLRGHSNTEVLMTRYGIYRGENLGSKATLKIGQLFVLPLTQVINEPMSPVGAGHTYASRDVGWYLGQQGEGALVQIQLLRNGVTYNLNGVVGQPNTNQVGRFDPTTGLLYFDAASTDVNNNNIVTNANNRPLLGGGRIVVDPRAGTVSFPDVAPAKSDTIQITYTPQVMRLNVSRDDSNLNTPNGYGNFPTNPLPPIFQPRAAVTAAGNNMSPTVILDRDLNPRTALTSPPVVFNGPMPTDRLWVFYRKSDPSGAVKSTVYYKTMRLMARLPYPVALGAPDANGIQHVQLNVIGANGPYEVDWVRGRVYFTEADEGRPVGISYTYFDPVTKTSGQSGSLVYVVAWGDEKTTGSNPDTTTQETALLTDAAVNEGQITAMKDPLLDKLWLFWSSTRGGTTDLFSEVLSPQLYIPATNQR